MRYEVREHINRVTGVIQHREPPHFQLESSKRLLASWQRSLDMHRVDPGEVAQPRVLTSTDLKEHRERLESLLRISRHAVTNLHSQVREANYCVLLTDASGATVMFEGVPSLDKEFRQEGFRAGTCWSEHDEGTNGVGTTIMDRVPTLVHKTEHFRAHNISFTCSAAPICGPNEELLAVLDASALYSPDDKRSQTLVFNLVVGHALAIENAFFVESFRDYWILQLSKSRNFVDVQAECFVALDPLGFIAAANRKAREWLSAFVESTVSIEKVFDCTALDLIRQSHERPGAPIPLRCLRTGEQFFCLLRAPAPTRVREAAAAGTRRPVQDPEPAPDAPSGFNQLSLGDDRVRQSAQQACKIANQRIPILLLGETGTGKESFARAVHRYSNRRDKLFIALNCAAIPESLIESELFGYTDGAFTGAKSKGSKGKILQADGGTLFLDEIGDMPLQLQTRLLRILAESEVLPLGADSPISVDLHVICATHCNLRDMVRQGAFREDLYYRLNAATFEMPPLRERGDKREIVVSIFREEAREQGRELTLAHDVVEALTACPWPGNFRELRNAMRYACALCEDGTLTKEHFAEHIAQGGGRERASAASSGSHAYAELRRTRESADQERKRLISVLARNKWQVAASARQVGVSRATFYRWMNRLGIVQPNKSASGE
jgi:sigma-54 dependent transcriptional regulator, acetoin dehydrogenase operon transcriptional activator AcoR